MPSLLTSASPSYSSPPLSTTTVMAQEAQWEAFSDGGDTDDGETLSLCDLPVSSLEKQEKDDKPSAALEDFEFRTLGNGLKLKPGPESEMCAADDIFYRGQLLPLRSCGGSSRSSRSFSSSTSNSAGSSNCSSTSISRSQSSSSQNSSNLDGPRLSTSNRFYAHPSPRPQVRTRTRTRTSIGSGRRSTGSAPPGWSVFRLGVAKAPEIELSDLKLRRLRSNEGKCEPKVTKSLSRLGFGCKCTPDVSEPVPMSPARPLIPKKKNVKEKETVIGFERRESICKSSRMFEWLEELSIGKGPALG